MSLLCFPLNKWTSLKWLEWHEYNVPHCSLVRSKDYLSEVVSNLKKDNRASFRLFRPSKVGETLHPFFPNVVISDYLLKELSSYLDKGYCVIVSEPIDSDKAIYKGNVMIQRKINLRYKEEKSFTLEYSTGKGTVRDISCGKEKIESLSSNFADRVLNSLRNKHSVENGSKFEKILITALSISNVLSIDFILEWSIYSIPVGIMQHPIIFWEVRRA